MPDLAALIARLESAEPVPVREIVEALRDAEAAIRALARAARRGAGGRGSIDR